MHWLICQLLKADSPKKGIDSDMDIKLAKGFAREGFRRSMNEAGPRIDARTESHAPFIEKLFRRGKLSKEDICNVIEIMNNANKLSESVIFFEKFVIGSKKSLSRQMDSLFVGGNCWSGPLSINDQHEIGLTYSLFYEHYNTKFIEFRTNTRPIYVRQHAISRFIERANSPFRSAAKSLWPGLLLIDALEYFDREKIAQALLFPTSQGAFLGVRALGTPPENVAGIERTTITPLGVQESKDSSSIAPLVPIWNLNTFISLEEMTDQQLKLRSHLEGMLEKHHNVLIVGHLCRIMTFADKLDDFELDARYPGNFEAAMADFAALAKSELWLRATREPKDGPFSQHFVAQALLEMKQTKMSQ